MEKNYDYYLGDLQGRFGYENRKWDADGNKLIRLDSNGNELYFYDILIIDPVTYSVFENIIVWVRQLFGFNLVTNKSLVKLNIVQRFELNQILIERLRKLKYHIKLEKVLKDNKLEDVEIHNGHLRAKVSPPQFPEGRTIPPTSTSDRHGGVIDKILQKKAKADKEKKLTHGELTALKQEQYLKEFRQEQLADEFRLSKQEKSTKFKKMLTQRAKDRLDGSIDNDDLYFKKF